MIQLPPYASGEIERLLSWSASLRLGPRFPAGESEVSVGEYHAEHFGTFRRLGELASIFDGKWTGGPVDLKAEDGWIWCRSARPDVDEDWRKLCPLSYARQSFSHYAST